MKRNWEYLSIGVCFPSIKNGANIKQIAGANGYPITRIETLSGGAFNRDRMGYANIVDLTKYQDYILESGDLLLSHINSKAYIGRTVKYEKQGDEKIIHGMNLLRLRANPEVISSSLFAYYSKSMKFKDAVARIRKDAVNQSSMAISDLKKIIVPVPPLDEQSRIVAELDLLTGIIDKQNAQLKKLDNLAQAIFYDMFGDLSCDECALIELCVSKDDIKCGPFGTQLSKSEYQKEGVAVWGIPQINSHFIIPPSDYVSQEKAVALKDYSVVAGDIVMSRKGNVGQCSVFPDSFENGIIHSDVLRLRLDYDKANSIFMMYQLHLSDSIKHQLQLVSSGEIMPGINVTQLKNIKVQVPPLALQQSFAEKIQSIEKQKETIRASIADTQKLLDYTMEKYFG